MTQNATPTQGTYQTPEGFETDHPQAAVGATFQRPVPNVRQQLQAQRAAAPAASSVPNPAHYQGAQPQPVQPGGKGPLSGYASGVSAPAAPQPAPQQQFQAQPQPAPQMQAAAPEASDPLPGGSAEAFAAQPFAHAPRRPSFPAAPSKVLAEQQALGGDGHIRDTEPAPAFDAPMEGPYLEGAYPAPEAAPVSPQAVPHPAAHPQASEQPGRAVPRYQHTDAAYSARAPQAEPTLSDPSLDQRGDQDSAFWAFSAGAEPTHDRPRWGLIVALLLAVFLLLGLLAFAAWSQFRAAPAPADPIRLSAEAGPEWIVPAEPGGLQVADQDLGVLNPDAIQADGSLAALPIATVQPAPIPPVEEALVIEEAIEVPTTSTAEGTSETTEPVIADAPPAATLPEGVPLPRPTTIPARAALPAAEAAAPAPEPQTPAASAPVAVESGVISTPPTGLYVQEGAYSTLANAQSAFATIKARGGSTFANITPLYHATTVNGAQGYKLYLIGFGTSLDAQLAGASVGRNEGNWFVRNG